MLVDGRDGKDRVLAHVGMSVLEAGSGRGEEGLEQLGLPEFGDEAQSVASNVLVGVLQVVPDTVARARSARPTPQA